MNWFQRILQMLRTPGSFVQNAAYMFSASAGGMVIQFLFMPLLSRVYDPKAYGLFGVFNAVLVIAGTAATLGFNQAFVLPKTEREFRALLSVTLRSGLVFAAVLTAIPLLGWRWLDQWSVTADLSTWWFLLGPLLLLLVIDRVLMDWSIRDKAFKRQSLWSIPITLGSKGFNLGYGYLVSATAEGHIFTTFINYLLRIGVYMRWVIPNARERLLVRSTRDERKQVIQAYADYPKFTLWSNLLNVGSGFIPVLLLPLVLEDVEAVGFYTFSLLVLEIPIRLLSSGITPVYMNKAAEVVRERPEELGALTFQLFRNVLPFAAVGMGLMYALGEPVYAWAFGEPWRTAGQAAEVLSVCYFFRLMSSPISPVVNIVRKEHEIFRFQILLFVMRFAALLPGFFWDLSFLELMGLYALANAISYGLLTQRIFHLLQHRAWRVLVESTVAIGVCLFIAHLLKTL